MLEPRTTAATVLAHLITIFLLFVLPFAGNRNYSRLKRLIASGDAGARLRFYKRGLLQQALLAVLVLTWQWLARVNPKAIGLSAPTSWTLAFVVLSILVCAIAFSVYKFRRTGDDKLKRALEMAGGIIPSSGSERRVYAFFGVGAGMVEELVCRGFLIYYLSQLIALRDPLLLVILSSIIFGFAHLYQGRRGIFFTGILGLCFAGLYLATGSLLVPVVIHVLIDLRILWLFTPARLRSLGVPVAASELQQA